MAETTNTVEIKTVVDATGVEVGLRRIGEAAAKTGRDLEKVGSGAGFNKVGADADGAAKKVNGSQRSIIGAIQRTTAEMESGSRTSAKYYEVLNRLRGLDGSALAPYLEQLRAVEAAQAKANVALGAAAPSLDRVGMSAKQTAAALRGVPAQFTDIFTSLQGGQAPLTVFLQQGGQLKDMFGGAGNAARAMGGYIVGLVNPFTVAAAAAVGLAMAYNAGTKEADAYARALITTGNTAGATVNQLSDMARAAGQVSGSQRDAAEVIAALAATGKVGATNMREFATVTVEAQRVLGKSVKDTVAEFEALGKSPVEALGKINEKYNFITAAVYAQVKALEDQGRVIEAANVAQMAYAEGVAGQRQKVLDTLTDWERGWLRIKKAANGAVDTVIDLAFGREATSQQQITALLKTREAIEGNIAIAKGRRDALAERRLTAQLEQNKVEINNIRAKEDAQKGEAAAESRTAAATQLRNKWLVESDILMTRAQKRDREIDAARQQGIALGLKEEEIQNRLAVIRKKYAETTVASSKSNGDALRKETALMAELAGLTSSFAADWDALSAAYARGKINLSQLTEAQAKLLAKQPAIKAANDAQAKSLADQAKFMERVQAAVDRDVESIESQTAALMLKVKTYGMLPAAITDVQIAELEMAKQSLVLTDAGVADIQRKIDALKGLRDAQATSAGQETSAAAAKQATDDWKRAAESIESSLTDALLRGFESGKGFGRNLIDTIKNMFGSLVLRPIISAIVNPVAGALTGAMGLSGTAQAAGGGASSGIGSALSSTLGISGAMSAFTGTLATGFMNTIAGTGLMSGLTAGGSMLAGGSIASGLGMVAGALGPIALGLAAAVAIWKKLDTSGTMHAGGAASATSSGVSAVSAGSLNMERIQTNGATQKMVSELASGMVKILDSTAQTFGKTAGYQAATAFADDTSKDGAWGSLIISKMGQSVVNWQDSRGNGKWSQKTFADGKMGQDQYLAALSASVRTALNDIGLPAWAQKMLDGLGGAPSMEEMAKVVEQINLTQRALKSMGEQLQGFASMSDSAVSALIAASGGIEALAGNASAYFDNFYSDAEKSASTVKAIGEVLAGVGLSLPATRDEFRKLVESQMAIGETGAPAVAALLKVAGAFAQVNPLMEEMAQAGRSAADVLSERIDLQKQLEQMTLTEVQLLAKRRAELDPSNRLLFDQVQAMKAAREAQDAAKTSMSGLIDRMKSFGDSARSLRDGLLMGSLSTLTPEQQYAEARRQRDTTLSAAMAGDTNAQNNLSAMQTAFLTISQKVNGGDDRYSSDFAEVLRISDDVAKWSTGQIDTAQASLNVMNDQLAQLIQMNATLQTVAQTAAPIALVGVPDYSTMGAANTTALVNEVKALNARLDAQTKVIEGLRSDQKQQTGDLIGAAVEISNRESDTVVKGVGAALNRGAGRYDNGVNLA